MHFLRHISLVFFSEFWHVARNPYGTKYSIMDLVKSFKGCLPQILLGLFLNTLSHIKFCVTEPDFFGKCFYRKNESKTWLFEFIKTFCH